MQSRKYNESATEQLQTLINNTHHRDIETQSTQIKKLLKDGASPFINKVKTWILEEYPFIEWLMGGTSLGWLFYTALTEGKIDRECLETIKKDPVFSIIMDIFQFRVNPDYVYTACFSCHNTKYYFRMTPLGLILLFQPENVPLFLENGVTLRVADPKKFLLPVLNGIQDYIFCSEDFNYDPVVLPGLINWLEGRFIIPEQAVTVLSRFKNELIDANLVTPENFLHTMDPRSAAGKILWAKTGDTPCSIYDGALNKVLNKLNLSPKILIALLGENGVIIDNKTGQWKPDSIIFHARKTLRDIEVEHRARMFFNRPEKTEIDAFETLKTAVYGNESVDKIIKTFDAVPVSDTGSIFQNAISQFREAVKPLHQANQTYQAEMQRLSWEQINQNLANTASFFHLFTRKADENLVVDMLVYLQYRDSVKLLCLSKEFYNIINKLMPNIEKKFNMIPEPIPSKSMAFFCKNLNSNNQIYIVYAEFYNTILHLKEKLAEASHIPVKNINFIQKNNILEDTKKILEYGIQSDENTPVSFTVCL